MKITDLSILCKWENLKIGSVSNTYLPTVDNLQIAFLIVIYIFRSLLRINEQHTEIHVILLVVWNPVSKKMRHPWAQLCILLLVTVYPNAHLSTSIYHTENKYTAVGHLTSVRQPFPV